MSLYVDIEKRLGAFHLRAQLEAPDETMALLGASGCGKSMTLKCIAGIVTPDRAEKRRVLAEKLRLFRLEGLEKKHPAQLSGGQQQRVALARILCAEPEAILLDEPFSALDSYLKWNLETELSSLLAAFKGPILWVSHDLGECYRNCRTVCVMEEGRTCAVTDMETLARHPSTQGAARLAGYRNFLPARRCDGGVELTGWGIVLPLAAAGEVLTVAIPDEAVCLPEGPYTAVVQRVVRDLHATVVLLRPVDGGEETLLRAVLPEGTTAAAGETVRFDLLAEKCLCCG